MGARFEINRDLVDDLVGSPVVTRATEGRAREALSVAQRIAAGFRVTGAYHDGLHVEGSRLVADDDASVAIEFGTVDTPTQAVLRRAGEAVGGTYVDDRR